jgi:hypothetical protein
MSYIKRVAAVAVTTAADGSATAYSEVCTGKVSTIRYVKTDFADGATITVTSEATGESIWTETGVNASATRAPRQATHSTAGAAALYAGGGAAVNDKIALAVDRLKIVIANGGNAKSGAFHIVME